MTRLRTTAAYEVSKLVYQSALSATEGARKLNADIGMNTNSAKDHFYVYRQLRSGAVFHRGLSVEDMDYYLARIESDEGEEAIRLALHSLWQHIGYYESVRKKLTLRSMRAIAAKHEERTRAPVELSTVSDSFAKAVEESKLDTPEQRRKRLASAPRRPAQVAVVALAFLRNPDVVAEVLARAQGECERCAKPAPFIRRKDNSPYLEVHHQKQLADGGEDTVENALALCPNCHREVHYGRAEA